ncbi:MAG TPA: ABC transporter permease [Firmicutes bacterium]|jgi:NitT/TauT family transport system permease protein|nr:ABC transporter permease [Bacillota bacterium]
MHRKRETGCTRTWRQTVLRALVRNNYEYFSLPLGLLLFLLIWEVASGFYPSFILPSPGEVWRRWQEFYQQRLFLHHFAATFFEAFGGFCVAAATALPLSYFLAGNPFLEKIFTPYIVGLQAVPILALAPLLVIWFGFGMTSKVLVAALAAFFPILTNGVVGFRGTDRRFREMMAIMGADRKTIFWQLEIPSALPVLFGGLRLGLTLSVIGAVVGEFAGAGRGLGYLVNSARGNFDTPLIFVALMGLAFLGIGFYLLLSGLEYLAVPWKRRQSR